MATLTIAGLGAGISAAGAGAAFATDYVVKPGDTLSEIAQANGANWHDLARINNLNDPDLILIGQTLTLDGSRKAAGTAPRKVTKKVESREVRKTERKVRSSRSQDRPASSAKANLSGAWAKVANCESSGNPRAVNGAGYYGLFQFDLVAALTGTTFGEVNPISAAIYTLVGLSAIVLLPVLVRWLTTREEVVHA